MCNPIQTHADDQVARCLPLADNIHCNDDEGYGYHQYPPATITIGRTPRQQPHKERRNRKVGKQQPLIANADIISEIWYERKHCAVGVYRQSHHYTRKPHPLFKKILSTNLKELS